MCRRVDPASGAQKSIRLPATSFSQALALRAIPIGLWLSQFFDLSSMNTGEGGGGGIRMPVPYGIDVAPDSSNILRADAEAVPLLGISAYYDHYWNEQWSTSAGWSMTDLDSSDGQSGTEFETGQIAQVNLLYYPSDNILMGTEFNWGQREDINGNTGTDYRLQFSLKVNFDSGNLMQR